MDDLIRSARIIELLEERGIKLVGEIRVLGPQWDFVLDDPDAAAERIRLDRQAFRDVELAGENLPAVEPSMARAEAASALRRLDELVPEGRAGGIERLVRQVRARVVPADPGCDVPDRPPSGVVRDS